MVHTINNGNLLRDKSLDTVRTNSANIYKWQKLRRKKDYTYT